MNGVEDRRMSVIWKVSFLPKLCCCSFPLCVIEVVAVTFLSKIFFLLRSSFYRPVVFIRPAILSHSAASPSFWPLPFRVIFSGQTGPSWPTVFSLPIPSSLGQRLVLKNCGQLVLSTDFLRSLEKFGHFPV